MKVLEPRAATRPEAVLAVARPASPAWSGGRRLAWWVAPAGLYLIVFLLLRPSLDLTADLAILSLRLFLGALVLYAGSMVAYFAFFAYRKERLRRVALALVLPGVPLHLLSIITRGFADGHYPLGNMYEYSSMFAATAVIAYLLITARYPVAALGGGLALFAAVAIMGSGLALYQGPEPLIPALQSYWLRIHVTSMMLSSGILVSSFVFAALYLIKERSQSPRSWLAHSAAAARLPSPAALDWLTSRAIMLGFPIWTFGTMAGAIWGSYAWGRWWGWDPKETWAAITWMIYAIYIHAHAARGWRGRRTALIATAGFVSILVTLYAVNLWIVGLHSYARGGSG
jgi:cytochrome c-type biogenesis protein CcsB